jgi:hypothetical protein
VNQRTDVQPANAVPRRALLAGWAAVTPLLVASLLMSGCGEPRGVNTTDVDLVVWYIEDVVHGNPRNPQELVLPGSSDEMARIATWLAGGTVRDQYLPPRQIAERRDRWPALKALFRQGQAVVLDDGLVAANPLVSKDDQTYALPIIDAENLDRRAINALLISMSKAERPEAKVWLARSTDARITLDTQGGAKRWVGKY